MTRQRFVWWSDLRHNPCHTLSVRSSLAAVHTTRHGAWSHAACSTRVVWSCILPWLRCAGPHARHVKFGSVARSLEKCSDFQLKFVASNDSRQSMNIILWCIIHNYFHQMSLFVYEIYTIFGYTLRLEVRLRLLITWVSWTEIRCKKVTWPAFLLNYSKTAKF